MINGLLLLLCTIRSVQFRNCSHLTYFNCEANGTDIFVSGYAELI